MATTSGTGVGISTVATVVAVGSGIDVAVGSIGVAVAVGSGTVVGVLTTGVVVAVGSGIAVGVLTDGAIVAVGSGTEVGVSTIGAAVAVGSIVGVGDGSELHAITTPINSAEQAKTTTNFKFATIYLASRLNLNAQPVKSAGPYLKTVYDGSTAVEFRGINSLKIHI